ncbi:T9SS type A sorting domain-containing protein [Flavobacterium sp.]|uniref:T9SS type A sorting domain-containing protein n=1 Tax=Flavobacterium sp. TaxID=239 RepID=UPI0011FEE3E7|nr:T9SS type A sorting domain-containing protein [Flavobacterium sp.]RZJ71718.1 MAG: T9SS type A sorting domain-containing protein [Flavobacterium sp.]
MKNSNTLFKKYLSLLAVIFGTVTGYAQTVSVPPGCTVVVAGIGGTTGPNPTGKVGDGGIVSMPDPSGGGTFTFNPPSGATTITWTLRGDLSNSTATPFYGAPTQPANGLTANIITYNKKLRQYSTEDANPSFGRSKGQVRVGYDQTGCGKAITFDVYKVFSTNLPIIIGPSCLKPLTEYTYSVDRIVSDNPNDNIGFDSYYWSGIPASLLSSVGFYTSTDNSSITFKTGATVTPFTLQCCYGRVNPNSADGGVSTVTTAVSGTHTSCVTKSLIVAPLAPVYSMAPPACVPTNQSVFSVVYPNAPSGQTYTWTAPNTGWVLTTGLIPPTNTETKLSVDTGGSTNPGQLILTITGLCDPVTLVYQIDRNITAPYAVVPSGGSTTCINATSSGNTYTITPSIGGNLIQWYTVPASVPGVMLQNATTSTVTVNTTNSSGSFQLHVRSSVAACSSTSVFTTINIRPATPTFTATTPTCVPLSSPALTTFAVNPVAGATSYTWSLPSGWSCTGNCTTSNPTLVPPVNTSAVSAPAMPAGTIYVIANSASGCSSAVAAQLAVNYIRITTNTLQSGSGNCDQYSINTNVSPCTGTISSWTVNGATAANSSTVNIFGNTLTLCGSTAPPAGGVCANFVINGVTYTTCSSTVATGTHGLKQSGPKASLEGITISPNPNDGNFSIRVDDFKVSATAVLTDVAGKQLGSYSLSIGENNIRGVNLAQGAYFVLLSVDGKQETRQIIVK